MKRFFATLLLAMVCLCAAAINKSGVIVNINGSKFYIHTVQAGETIYGLAKFYNVTEKSLAEHNPTIINGVKAGEMIKIPFVEQAVDPKADRKLLKTFDFHTVVQGETLYAISRKYEIPIQTIIEDNPTIDPSHLSLDQRILIRKKAIGTENETPDKEQWREYNSVAEQSKGYHIVRAGETFYSLARRFGVTEEQLSALNGGLTPQELKVGAIIRVQAAHESSTVEEVVDTLAEPLPYKVIKEVDFRALSPNETLNIALLLPMSAEGENNANFLDFYRGFLLGLDKVKNEGYSVNVGLFNTARNKNKVREIIDNKEFRRANLIIGPVYEDVLQPVIEYAEEREIPVISPLANLATTNSDVIFQLAPDTSRKWEKIADLIGNDRKITLIYSGNTDQEFENEILILLKNREFHRHDYQFIHPSLIKTGSPNPSDLSPLLDNRDDNLFIIMSADEVDVDRILAAIASADTNLTARKREAPRYFVLGNARWNRFRNIDRTVFFRNRVVFVSSYNAKRDSAVIREFDSDYIRAFGSLPTLFSYRGYDTAVIFAPAMYSEIEYDLGERKYTPLQTSYRFEQGGVGSNHINREWMRVSYNRDFTITVE